ncbi:MAG: hypothetical protein OEM28_09425 [Nitrosopumilus sp.]|nr:hypothetical protein [Nitrosopumilus sp.]
MDTICYESLRVTIIMETEQTTTLDKMVHAPFKKVVKFDLICMGIGVVMGMGAGAYLVASGILG